MSDMSVEFNPNETHDDFDIKEVSTALSRPDGHIKMEEWVDPNTGLKTQSVAKRSISSHAPMFSDGAELDGRVSLGDPAALSEAEIAALQEDNQRLEAVASQLEQVQAHLNSDQPDEVKAINFPNLAMEAVYAALEKERITNAQIAGHVKEAKRIQKDIDLLLDLNASLVAHKGDELSQETQDILSQLKDRGIDLWKSGDNKVSKEKISELRALSNSQVDKSKSNLQIIFTTKIQTLTQTIGAIFEAVKDIIRNNNRLIEKANRLPGH